MKYLHTREEAIRLARREYEYAIETDTPWSALENIVNLLQASTDTTRDQHFVKQNEQHNKSSVSSGG